MNNVNKILVVGKNSFIGQNFHTQSSNIDLISHKEISITDFTFYGTVLNCSISPDFRTKKYEEQNDIDFIVAKKSYENGCHFVMLSTRKVYGQSNELVAYTESSEIKPIDNYSLNDLWAVCDCCSVINNVVDNLISIKYKKIEMIKNFIINILRIY